MKLILNNILLDFLSVSVLLFLSLICFLEYLKKKKTDGTHPLTDFII